MIRPGHHPPKNLGIIGLTDVLLGINVPVDDNAPVIDQAIVRATGKQGFVEHRTAAVQVETDNDDTGNTAAVVLEGESKRYGRLPVDSADDVLAGRKPVRFHRLDEIEPISHRYGCHDRLA